MKRTLLNTLMLVLALGPGSLVYADTASSTASTTRDRIRALEEQRKELRNEIKDVREERKDLRESLASSTEKRILKMRDELRKQFNKSLKRLGATIEREQGILTKLNSRIAKIKAGGGNTTEAEKLALEAKGHLDEAKTALTALTTAVGNAVQSVASTTGAIKKDAHDKMKDGEKTVEMHIKEAHKAMEKSLGSLRGQSQLHATTTKDN